MGSLVTACTLSPITGSGSRWGQTPWLEDLRNQKAKPGGSASAPSLQLKGPSARTSRGHRKPSPYPAPARGRYGVQLCPEPRPQHHRQHGFWSEARSRSTHREAREVTDRPRTREGLFGLCPLLTCWSVAWASQSTNGVKIWLSRGAPCVLGRRPVSGEQSQAPKWRGWASSVTSTAGRGSSHPELSLGVCRSDGP